MLRFFYQWLQNFMTYLVVTTVILHLVPNDSYKKYIRFFTGMILILMLAEPMLRLVNAKNQFQEYCEIQIREQREREKEVATQYWKDWIGEEQVEDEAGVEME